MEIEFIYKDIIDRCEQLSSFESMNKLDAAGESRYLEIHINEVDKLLIRQYVEQARLAIEEKLARMIAFTENTDTSFTWHMRTDTRWSGTTSFTKHATEAIVAYTMSAWLSDRLPDRVAFYDALFTNSLAMAVKNIFTKQAPSK
jgi:hypothetical protein